MITKKSLNLTKNTHINTKEDAPVNDVAVNNVAVNDVAVNDVAVNDAQVNKIIPPQQSKFKIIKKIHTFEQAAAPNAPISQNDAPNAPNVAPNAPIAPNVAPNDAPNVAPNAPNVENDSDNEQENDLITNFKSDNEILIYLKKLNIDSLKKTEKFDEIIDTLETYRYQQRKKIKVATKNKTPMNKMETTLEQIENVLSEIKQVKANIDISKNQKEKDMLIDTFKKKYKKMSDRDFKIRIDLTAPKDKRKPEISLTIIEVAKNTVYQDNSYKNAPIQKIKNFKNEFNKKILPMNDDILDQIKYKQNNNLSVMVDYIHRPELFKCKKYNIYNT